MGSLSIWHWLIVLAVVLVLFGGRGKISQLMGDFGKGVKSFKKGIGGEENDEAEDEPKTIEQGKDATLKQTSESESATKS